MADRFTHRNYWVFVWEGGFFIGGVSFVAQDTVLPAAIKSLGGPDYILAIAPMLMMMGFMLPPLFTAHLIERLQRMMPILTKLGIAQRVPYMLAAMALLWLGDDYPLVALAFVLACPFVSGLCGGMTLGAWMTVTARTVRAERRASGSALRMTIGALIGVGASVIVDAVLRDFPGSRGFAILHGLAFIVLALSWLVFSCTDEPEGEPIEPENHRSFRDQLASIPGVLRDNPWFVRYLLSRFFSIWTFILIPFLAVHAMEATGQGQGIIGSLLASQMIGGICGNVFAGFVGDRYGAKLAIVFARCLFLGMVGVLFFNTSAMAFTIGFFLWGFIFSCQMIGGSTLTVELSTGRRLPTFVAIIGLSTLVGGIFVAFFSTFLRYTLGGITPLLIGAATGTLISIALLLSVPEPRGRNWRPSD